MGALIRSFDWSTTALGSPDEWPQSLRIAVRIMLDCPFGMYIAWGNDYIQLYNDGYRPILGTTKHPQALGLSTRQTFAEIWPTIGPMFDGVMEGIPVGFPDFILQLGRNGYLEECVFDFSYSPIRLEDGEVGGVLVTVIETTEKVKAVRALKESEQELQFAIEATELGTWDLNPATNKFKGNSRLKDWFGLKPEEEIDLAIGLDVIADKDKDRVTAAIQTALQFSSGGHYDCIYTIVHPQTKNERIVRAKGQASFNKEGIAYRFNGTLQDVTTEMVARQLLTESETKFRTLSESIPHMVWTATPNGKRSFFNKHFIDYTGLSFEQLRDDGWHDIIFPEDLEKELQKWNYSFETGEDFRIEKRIRRHDGAWRWHLCHSIAQKDSQGNIIGWIGTNTEIEEQKAFSQELEKLVNERTTELEERKNFVETILETSKEYIAVYGKDLKIITINKATEILMGQKREDVIGKTLLELMPQSNGSREESQLKSALEGHNIYNEPYQSSITGRYIENYINPLKDKEGNVYAAVAMANDVTNIIMRQKEIEAAKELVQIQNQTFEAAERIANFGSYKWNFTTGVLEYSDNLFRLLDCEPNEFEPSFEKFLSFIHPDDLEQVSKNGEETMQTGVLVETPYRIVSKTGKVKHFRSSGSFTGDAEKRILIGTVQDISKDVEAAEELRTKNIELELTNAELTSFSYVASHDLQEPLRKIQAFSKLILQAQTFEGKTQDYFNRIIAAGERMQNLIVSLLDFSRTSETELIFTACNLNSIVEECKDNLQFSILEKKAVIAYDNLPTIMASQIQFCQLFTNLIDNAIKYSRPQVNPYIKITATVAKGNEIENPLANNQKEYHQIKIEDNGIGFEKEYVTKIFELFQRLHGRSEYSGTGIGLAIVKRIMTNHNGFIVAEGRPGNGSTFFIYIPTA